MNTIVLVQKDNPASKENYACGKCHQFWGGEQKLADECCGQRICECGTTITEKHFTVCAECRAKREVEREAALFEKATKVTLAEYEHEVVYWEGSGSGDMGDGFWSIDALLEHCEQEEIELPEYVWGCTPKQMMLDGTDIVSRELEDAYENAFDDVSEEHLRQLNDFLTEWCKKENIVSWDTDMGVAVMLPQPEAGDAKPPPETPPNEPVEAA